MMNQVAYGEQGIGSKFSFSQADVAVNKLLSRAHLKMGEWQEFMVGFDETSIPTILSSYQRATVFDTKWYKAWHSWAFMNFRALKYAKELKAQVEKEYENKQVSLPDRIKGVHAMPGLDPQKSICLQQMNEYCVSAVTGFFESILLSQGSSLQDILRLLTLWFEEGKNDKVSFKSRLFMVEIG